MDITVYLTSSLLTSKLFTVFFLLGKNKIFKRDDGHILLLITHYASLSLVFPSVSSTSLSAKPELWNQSYPLLPLTPTPIQLVTSRPTVSSVGPQP